MEIISNGLNLSQKLPSNKKFRPSHRNGELVNSAVLTEHLIANTFLATAQLSAKRLMR